MAPLLAVTADESHAFLIVRPGWLELHRHTGRTFELDGARQQDDGTVEINDPSALRGKIEDGSLIPVDCVAVTDPALNWHEARERCRPHMVEGLKLIDVPWLQEYGGLPPHPKPGGWPSVRRFPPGGKQDIKLYRAQERIVDQLEELDIPVVAITGASGQGKSAIARWLVDRVENDAGWFLNASDPQALIDSLADAEVAHAGLPRAELERPDREGFALRALQRLRTSSAPWLVVLDNADGDPKPLQRFVPRPGHGQRVVITTAPQSEKPGWDAFAVRCLRLEDVEPGEIARQLQSSALDKLIDGRALMLHAFQQLLTAEHGLIAADLANMAPTSGRVSDESVGPTVLWRAIQQQRWFTPQHLRLAVLAAHMPPDTLPVATLEFLAGTPGGAVAELAARGLFESPSVAGLTRLHRLFGRTIVSNVEHELEVPRDGRPTLLEDVVLQLATSPETVQLFTEHGDLRLVLALLDRLRSALQRGINDARLKRALRNVGLILEVRGDTAASGLAYDDMRPMLGDEREDRQFLAEYHHAHARIPFRYSKNDEEQLREGLEHAINAHNIAVEIDDGQNVGRFLAMQGLVMRALARFPRADKSELELGRDALEVLEKAHQLRALRLGKVKETHPEWARSYFNLAGTHIPLARAEPEQATYHLDTAEEIYTEVRRLRENIYATSTHALIAPCVQGLGLVAYYRAMLVADSRQERSEFLRQATHRLSEALAQWEEIEGPEDGAEARKVSGYIVKVALARNLHAILKYKPHPERDGPRKLSGKAAPLITEAIEEIGFRHECD